MRFGDENEAPRRKRRTWCPKVRPKKPPKGVGKKSRNQGLCDYVIPGGYRCRHWQSPDSYACWCHYDAYEELMSRDPVDRHVDWDRST